MSDAEEASPPDAIALFRPKNKSMILPFLDLDDGEESDGLYAEELEDGSFLVHTFQPFDVFDANPNEARLWLKQFGQVLPEVHDDPRGLLFFPADDDEPESTTYDAVVKEVGEHGVWIALTEVMDGDDVDVGVGVGAGVGAGVGVGDEDGDYEEEEADLQGMPGINMEMLQKLAGQMMGNVDESGAPKAVSSFDVGQMFEQMQRGLMETLTAEATKMQQGAPLEPGEPGEPGQPGELGEPGEPSAPHDGEVIDEEFAPDPPTDPTKKK